MKIAVAFRGGVGGRGFLFLVILCCVVPGMGRSAHAAGGGNAAVVYERAFGDLSSITMHELNDVLSSVIYNPVPPVTDECKAVLRRHRGSRKLLLRATGIQFCDFGVEVLNPTTYVPYLIEMNRSSKYLLADAVHRLQTHDFDGAMISIRAIYGMVHHLEQNKFSGGSYQAWHLLRGIDGVLEYANDLGAIDAGRSQRLLSGISRLNRADLVGIISATALDYDNMLYWYADMYDTGRARELDSYVNIFHDEEDVSLDDFGRDKFHEALDHAAPIFDQITSVLVEMEEKGDQKEEIEKLVELLKENELSALLFPMEQIRHIVSLIYAAKGSINKQEKMLTALAQGKVVQEEMRDAAFLYARGAELLYAIPAGEFEKLYGIVSTMQMEEGGGRHIHPDADLVKAMKEIMEVYEEASTIDKCEFSKLRRDLWGVDSTIMLSPDYSGGMMDIIDLLHLRIKAATHEGQGERVGSDLQFCLRILHHLAGDELITSSMAAHGAFNKTFVLYEKALEKGIIEQEEWEKINARFGAFANADPFRYLANGKRARKDLGRCASRVQDEPIEKGRLALVLGLLQAWAEKNPMSAIFLWSVFVDQAVEVEGDKEEGREVEQRRQRFRDFIFDRGTYGQAMSNSTIIVSLILNGDGEGDEGWKPTGVINLREQFGLARKDLRRVGGVLRKMAIEDSARE